jgi:hypothetical protein
MRLAMWRHPLLVLSFVLAACAAPTSATWQKAGASDATKAKDTSDCHGAAQKEALRLYPYGSNPLLSGSPGGLMYQQHDERVRSDAEGRSFDLCMRNKGYARTSPPS